MVFDKLFVASQHVLPKHGLTHLAGTLAEFEGGVLTTAFIRAFIHRYGVDMSEAYHSDPGAYASFNEFFTRPLKAGARQICAEPQQIACPVDGAISQAGKIESGRVLQAKGHSYSLSELVGGDEDRADDYRDGEFATIYLSPKDYHRVHMPQRGTLREMVYVPGELYSVNAATVEYLPGLFARNERVVCHFDTDQGPLAMILVGATIVGSVETVWAGTVAPPRAGTIQRWHYPTQGEQAIVLDKGEEMGRFKLGSTVILLYGQDCAQWQQSVQPAQAVRLGQPLGTFVKSKAQVED